MTDRLPGSFSLGKIGKNKSLLSNLLLAVLAALVVWGIYSHFHKKSANEHIVTGLNLTNAQKIAQSSKAAQESLKNKDYQSAVSDYYGAATNAFIAKDYAKAKSLLQQCIKQVPDKEVPWYIYNTLALVAKQQNDRMLERDSLQKAIDKATVTPGVSKETISAMVKMLQDI